MKVCSICQVEKSLTEFHKNKSRKDGIQSHCKPCAIAARVDYYRRNGEKEKARNHEWGRSHREWFANLKRGIPCADCGISYHPVAMQWDHREEFEKVAAVSAMISDQRSKASILAEIEKCDLRCANCHAIKTWAK